MLNEWLKNIDNYFEFLNIQFFLSVYIGMFWNFFTNLKIRLYQYSKTIKLPVFKN